MLAIFFFHRSIIRERDRDKDSQTETDTDTQIYIYIYTGSQIKAERQTGRETQTETQTDTERVALYECIYTVLKLLCVTHKFTIFHYTEMEKGQNEGRIPFGKPRTIPHSYLYPTCYMTS